MKEHELSVKFPTPITKEISGTCTEAELIAASIAKETQICQAVSQGTTGAIAEKIAEYCDSQPPMVMESEVLPKPPQEAPKSIDKISDLDKLALDLAKEKKLTAMAQAETANAKLQAADLAFRYVILQLYHKYHLSVQDQLSEDGSISYSPKEIK